MIIGYESVTKYVFCCFCCTVFSKWIPILVSETACFCRVLWGFKGQSGIDHNGKMWKPEVLELSILWHCRTPNWNCMFEQTSKHSLTFRERAKPYSKLKSACDANHNLWWAAPMTRQHYNIIEHIELYFVINHLTIVKLTMEHQSIVTAKLPCFQRLPLPVPPDTWHLTPFLSPVPRSGCRCAMNLTDADIDSGESTKGWKIDGQRLAGGCGK